MYATDSLKAFTQFLYTTRVLKLKRRKIPTILDIDSWNKIIAL